jgi:hypothetical protein
VVNKTSLQASTSGFSSLKRQFEKEAGFNQPDMDSSAKRVATEDIPGNYILVVMYGCAYKFTLG